MGVPAFFRWLTRKYPSVIIESVENKNEDDQGNWVREDSTLPNPNGVEFDNLYLDMNGIIHPCTHPEDKPAPKNEDEMMVAIFECIDRLFNIVRPRKVLYMAIDGVAPRAKMNQQRSRRFRASKEIVEKQVEISRVREKLISAGAAVLPEKPKGEHFDSNCITPGTPFMERLSRCLHYYIHDRLNNDAAWKKIKVFLSDANVPGEGEHKIMDYIRRQRAHPDHDPNTQHVLCGADADLIMLGLATHEPNFTIIREEFLPNKPRPCEICGQVGHDLNGCDGITSPDDKIDVAAVSEVKFIFVRLSVLKEYLRKTLEMPNLPFKYDFDRTIDDWVFMCFFVGNDFLPHLPSLEIREGAIDRLVELYKKCVYKTGGYLTDSGDVNLDRVQMIMNDLGLVEDEIFRQRQKRELSFRARDKVNKNMRPNFSKMHNSKFGPIAVGREKPAAIQNIRHEIAKMRNNDNNNVLESMLKTDTDGNSTDRLKGDSVGRGVKRKHDELEEEVEEEDPQANDEVRLWESGFKDRYYESKFDVNADNLQYRYSVALQYIRGLCWVLQYYYQGCASWDWYFPYHYAPFASDFVCISGLSTKFEKGSQPFKPLEQLMGVFPAASSSHVPKPWANLMSDPNSTIIDFYPEDFKIDLNGKKFAWQGVALLPFVDEKRLIKTVKPYYDMLTQEEVKRNERGDDRLYVACNSDGYKLISKLFKNKTATNEENVILIEGVKGTVLLAEDSVKIGGTLSSPINGLRDVEENQVLTARFRDPKYVEDFTFKAARLSGAKDPPCVLAPDNRPSNYRPQIGFTRNIPQASLGGAGHRMLDHHSNSYNQQQQQHRAYSSVPPHQQQYGNNQYGNSYNDNNRSYDRNRGYNADGGGGGGGGRGKGGKGGGGGGGSGGGGGGGGGGYNQSNNRGNGGGGSGGYRGSYQNWQYNSRNNSGQGSDRQYDNRRQNNDNEPKKRRFI